MTATICSCGRPVKDAFVCDQCSDDLAKALGEVPSLSEDLDLTLSRQRRFGDGGGSRSSVTPLVFNTGASAAIDVLRNELSGWVRVCDEERVKSSDPANALPDNNLASMSRWLIWRVDGLALNQAGNDAVRGITGAVDNARRVIDRPAERTYAGPCDECKADLYVVQGASTVDCHSCGLQYDVAERRAWLLVVVRDRLATATEIGRALSTLDMPVTPQKIYDWRKSGRLVVKGHTSLPEEYPLYRVGDVEALVIEAANREQERRTRHQKRVS